MEHAANIRKQIEKHDKYAIPAEWIDFQCIATADNSANEMTKANPRIFFYQHMNHIMGKLIPAYAKHLQ